MVDTSAIDETDLESLLSKPSEQLRDVVSALDGDILVLGAGGKMGPTLAMMLKRAAPKKTVYAVSRFSDAGVKDRLGGAGVTTVCADLLDRSCYAGLPMVRNVYYLVGMKFGTTGQQALTWAMNSYLPGMVAEHYRRSRMVVLSTGNVYPFVAVEKGGPTEEDEVGPVGEYAQSCLGRERICRYFSEKNLTPMTVVRLNYANEPRYGIIVDLATKIMHDKPIDLHVPAVNLIWQRDANDYIARAITLAESPPFLLNVTGPEILMVRDLAARIGRLVGREPRFTGEEGERSLLSDASRCIETLGSPQMSLDEMISMIIPWVSSGKRVLNKPTKYDVSDGKF